ncbi:hypothetical protein TNCV_2363281 [Trichonephila clavipes]|nr:hypothetical protein TNCV_2363281 [Trichonephila clavipes]
MAWLVCRWPSAPKVPSSAPAQIGGSSWTMSYGYTACKRSLKFLFACVLKAKLNLRTGLHRQGSGSSL